MKRLSLLCLLLGSAAAAADAPSLTAAQAADVFQRQKSAGTSVPGPELSKMIGIEESRPYSAHFDLRVFTGDDGVEHTIGLSQETKDYLLIVHEKGLMEYIHADAEFKLVGGAYYKYKVNDPPQPLLPREATAALLSRELSLWAARAQAK